MNSFLSRENVDMLVEILLDDKPNKTQGDVNQIIQEINVFRNTHLNSSAVSNVSLLELNQQFLKRMISQTIPSNKPSMPLPQSNQIMSLQSMQNASLQSSVPNPNMSSLQSPNSSYRNEDLKAERLDFFDKQLNQRRQEFESAITLKKPAPPIFEDSKMLDKPISNMEELIAQTMAQRNFDISNISSSQSSDWLSSISTSVKVEKQELNGLEEKEKDKEKEKKTISFEEPPPITNSIFARLKPNNSLNNSLETQIEILTNRVTLLEEQMAELRTFILK